MPRSYKRTSTRESWPQENMEKAIEEVLSGRMGYKLASKSFTVPQTTLESRVKKARAGISLKDASKKGLGRYKPVFTPAQENELVDHILHMESRQFGLTLGELRSVAFELAEKNDIPNNFNKNTKQAGKEWMYGFLRRHPNIKLRTPEATSIGRAMGFNRVAVQSFFNLLSGLCDKYQFSPDRIFNVDETGITTVPNKMSKVLSLRGKRQIGAIVSAERGTLVTAETCMSASGAYMPTMFIFPRKRAKPELLYEAPPGTTAEYDPSGWMTKIIFLKWFDRFIEFSRPSEEKPVLLLLDGHASHTKNIELIAKARQNHVILLCFPPHCTHRMQPLNVSFMAPLSQYYSDECRKWLRLHPGRAITQFQIGKLYGSAFIKAASMETAINGFRKTGIYPLDSKVFPDWMFAPSETTNMPIELDKDQHNDTEISVPFTPSFPAGSDISTELIVLTSETQLQEPNQTFSESAMENAVLPPAIAPNTGPHVATKNLEATSVAGILASNSAAAITTTVSKELKSTATGSILDSMSPVASTSFFSASPASLLSIPQVSFKKRCSRRRGKTAVLTSSPYRAELEESLQKQATKRKTGTTNSRNTSKKICFSKLVDSSSESDHDDALCIFCNEKYSKSKSNEGWVMCSACRGWAHEACTSIDAEDCESYICDLCIYK